MSRNGYLYSVRLVLPSQPTKRLREMGVPTFGDVARHRFNSAEEPDFSKRVVGAWSNPPPREEVTEERSRPTYELVNARYVSGESGITAGGVWKRTERDVASTLRLAANNGEELERTEEDSEDFALGVLLDLPRDSRQGYMLVDSMNGKTAYAMAKSGITRAATEVGLKAEVKAVTVPDRYLQAIEDDRIKSVTIDVVGASDDIGTIRSSDESRVRLSSSRAYRAVGDGFLRLTDRWKNYFLGRENAFSIDNQPIGEVRLQLVLHGDTKTTSVTVGNYESGRAWAEPIEWSGQAVLGEDYLRALRSTYLGAKRAALQVQN